MLRIYLCTKCGSTRIVSNNHDNSCFLCNKEMLRAPISYEEYVNLDLAQRKERIALWIDNFTKDS